MLAVGLGACTAKPTRDVAQVPAAKQVLSAAQQVAPPSAVPQSTPRVRFIQEKPGKDRIEELYPKIAKRIDVRAKSKRGKRPPPGDISLEFKDANLNEVVGAILGDILKRNYVIDNNVTGKVTLTTDRPLREEELVPTLEAVLAAQGAKLVNLGGVYRITRSDAPSALAGDSLGVKGKTEISEGNLLVFPLEYITADAMAKILKPLLPKNAILQVQSKPNILIIGGSGPELRLAASTVEIFDVDQMADQNVLMISVENAPAKVVVPELRAIFGIDSDTGGRGDIIRFMAIERLNAILVMSSQQAYIDKARDWIYRLDRNRDPTERRLFVYYVQNGRASKLAEGLRDIIGEIERRGDGAKVDGADKRAEAEKRLESVKRNIDKVGTVEKRDGQTTATVYGQPAKPAGEAMPAPTPASATANGALSIGQGGGLRISVDDEHNALLISATPQEFEMIDEVLAKLDIQPLQVMVEVTIFEVTLNDQLRYGIQYAISNGGLGLTHDGTIALTRDTTTATSGSIITPIIAPFLPGFSFAIEGSSRTRFIIDALSDITELKVISSPNILVVNNQVARLLVGDEVPIITQTTTSAVTDNPLIVNTVQYRNTGVSLEVTPQVNASGMVRLEIAQNVSDVTATTSSTINSPTIQNRSLVSTVSVRNGDMVMLGGLIRQQAQAADSGLPLLHDLPVIGPLFGQKNNTASRTELVILIRPVIAASANDTVEITREMQRKFRGLLRHQNLGIRQPRQPQEGG